MSFQLASDVNLDDRPDAMGVSTIMEIKTSGAVEMEVKGSGKFERCEETLPAVGWLTLVCVAYNHKNNTQSKDGHRAIRYKSILTWEHWRCRCRVPFLKRTNGRPSKPRPNNLYNADSLEATVN